MEFCYKYSAWSALIELLVDSVNEDNGNVRRSLATSVNDDDRVLL